MFHVWCCSQKIDWQSISTWRVIPRCFHVTFFKLSSQGGRRSALPSSSECWELGGDGNRTERLYEFGWHVIVLEYDGLFCDDWDPPSTCWKQTWGIIIVGSPIWHPTRESFHPKARALQTLSNRAKIWHATRHYFRVLVFDATTRPHQGRIEMWFHEMHLQLSWGSLERQVPWLQVAKAAQVGKMTALENEMLRWCDDVWCIYVIIIQCIYNYVYGHTPICIILYNYIIYSYIFNMSHQLFQIELDMELLWKEDTEYWWCDRCEHQ